MSKNIGILHLSDIHACAKNKQTLDRLVEKLKADLDILQSENATEIKFICITGDLIHSGDKEDEEMDIVINSVISPLMEYLKLSAENVFIVPGNHEVKRSLIIDYVEKGLTSLLTSEIEIDRYDFRAKEDFLISLVSEMLHQNRFYLSYCEFSCFLGEYHSQKGFDIVETQFDKVFFQSGILVRANEIVKFRYNCMIEYYTAKRAAEEPQFLNDLLTNQKYIHFPNEILYYTGLNRRSLDVLKAVQTDLRRYYTQIGSVTEELNNYQIEVDISLPEEVFSQKLEQGRLTQEESDELSDVRSSADPENAEIIDKSKEINEGSAFAQTLQIFGNCIKNLEFIDIEEKHEAFCDYLLGLSIILALMKQGAEMNCEQEIKEMLEAPEEYSDKDIEELKRITNDFIKIALPICIQNIALDNIGTIKLKSTYGPYLLGKLTNRCPVVGVNPQPVGN